jgi:hypothetical protein
LIIAGVLSILAGATGVAAIINADPTSANYKAVIAVTIVSIAAAIVNAVYRVFSFEPRAAAYAASKNGYGGVEAEIAHFLTTPQPDRKQIELFTQSIMIKMGQIESTEEV